MERYGTARSKYVRIVAMSASATILTSHMGMTSELKDFLFIMQKVARTKKFLEGERDNELLSVCSLQICAIPFPK